MTEQILSPTILGYWTDEQRLEIPDASGIFLVFRAGTDPETKSMEVQELLYLGEHRSARYGIENDATRKTWQAFLQPDEELWYAVGLCTYLHRDRLAAAMINAHKPRFNDHSEYLDRFPFDETTVQIHGKKDKLQSTFTVQPSD